MISNLLQELPELEPGQFYAIPVEQLQMSFVQLKGRDKDIARQLLLEAKEYINANCSPFFVVEDGKLRTACAETFRKKLH